MTTYPFDSMENTNTPKQYDNNNKGAIWKNNYKTTEAQPAYRGIIHVEESGEHNISLWVKIDKKGDKYFSTAQTKRDAIVPTKPVQSEVVADGDIEF